MNVVVLRGKLSRDPDERILDSGTRLVRYEVTTRSPEGRAETVPVVWMEAPDKATAFAAGEEVVVRGRVRRRWFRGRGVTESRTEVAAADVVPGANKRRVRSLVNRALDEVSRPAAAAAPPVR